MLVFSLPPIADDLLTQRRKTFASDWSNLTHAIFSQSGLESVSYRNVLKHSIGKVDGDQIDTQ
ncbi:hypothetical protein SARC_17032, partial [Sphaeroforma arctica JP610]